MTLAGAKKWVPATSCGRLVALAMMSMSMPEVFENNNAPGFIVASSLAKTSSLTGMRSNTASITTSAWAISS